MNVGIKKVVFTPGTSFTVVAMIQPTFEMSRIITSTSNQFESSWFWHDTMPEQLKSSFATVIHEIDVYLQTNNIIPRDWPDIMKSKPVTEDYPFVFTTYEYTLYNHNWITLKNSVASVMVRAESMWLTPHDPVKQQIQLMDDLDLDVLFDELKKLL